MGRTATRAVFLYDGDCAFCSSCARLIARWTPTTAWIVAWQRADLAGLGLTERDCRESVQWVATDVEGRRAAAAGPAAVAALLRSSTAVWRVVGWALDRPHVLAVAGHVYRWVARNRYRLPGGTPACSLPPSNDDVEHAPSSHRRPLHPARRLR